MLTKADHRRKRVDADRENLFCQTAQAAQTVQTVQTAQTAGIAGKLHNAFKTKHKGNKRDSTKE